MNALWYHMRSIDITHYANKIVYRIPILNEGKTRNIWYMKPRIIFEDNCFFVIIDKRDPDKE